MTISTAAIETPLQPPTKIVDGFGDRHWYDEWHGAFALRQRRYSLDVPGMDFRPEFIEGTVRVLKRPFRFLRAPINSHTPRYGWKLCKLPNVPLVSDRLSEVLRISAAVGIEVGLVPEGGLTQRLLHELSTIKQWVVAEEPDEQNYLIDVEGPWEDYWRKRSANLAKTVRWKENKLKRLGCFSFSEVGQRDEWVYWFEQALKLEAAGWKGQQGSAILQHRNELEFYRRVSEAAANQGRLRLFIATLDGRLIAFQLMVAEGDVLFLLKLAYDETLRPYSPGNVLQGLILKECFFEPSVRMIDLGGPGEWKLRWATSAARLLRVRLAPVGSIGGWLLRGELIAKLLRSRWHHLTTRRL